MPKSYLHDIVLMEDLLEDLASKGYTLAEVDDMFEQALEETGYSDEEDDEDE